VILCVGIGNTNIRCAVGSKESYRQAILKTDKLLAPNDFINFLEKQFQSDIWELFQGSIISSVVPQKTAIITDAIQQKNSGILIRRVDAAKCGIDISGYNSRLGEDRAVCCAAGIAKYKSPTVVVDFGTATTVNVINADNIFVGGAVMVGVQTGLSALNRRTTQLPEVNDDLAFDVICDDTKKSLMSGAVMGTAYAVEGYIKYVQTSLKCTPTVIITGGNAPLIIKHCRFDFIYEPMLLIDGLFELYNQNYKGELEL
jgi:type III pantothenate kinase